MKTLLLLTIMTLSLSSENIQKEYLGLFASVVNVTSNDVLNVREKPNSKAKKVGEISPILSVGIEKCKSIKDLTWCRVYPLVQNWSENFWEDKNIGWANARYLKFSNRGYVIVKGKRNCAYALDCHNGKCEVVDGYVTDKEHNIKELKTQWLERKYLKGESNFGVTPDSVDGYCNIAILIEDYLASENMKR